jgi:hypothetical protein
MRFFGYRLEKRSYHAISASIPQYTAEICAIHERSNTRTKAGHFEISRAERVTRKIPMSVIPLTERTYR